MSVSPQVQVIFATSLVWNQATDIPVAFMSCPIVQKEETLPTTTKKHFEYFKKRFKYWCSKLGVSGWSVYITHRHIDGCYSKMHLNYKCRAATLELNIHWNPERRLNLTTLDTTALHEAAHLLVAPLESLTFDRFVTSNQVDVVVEELVNRIEVALGDGE
jgi:hypothetical protein